VSTLSTAGWRVIRSALILWEKVKGNPTSFYDKLGPITEFSWGHFVIDDCHHAGGEFPQGVGSDIWVLGGRVSAWRERTGHVLNIEMIPNVFYDGVAVLVIGLGVCEAVRCSLEVVRSI